jgi:hypothetical protein
MAGSYGRKYAVGRLLFALVILGSAAMQPVAGPAQEAVPVTDALRNGIVQAIQDEIYDYGYQGGRRGRGP